MGELLLAFFKDFGTELDFVYKVSSVRCGGLLHKTEKNWSKDSAVGGGGGGGGRTGGGRIRHWMAGEFSSFWFFSSGCLCVRGVVCIMWARLLMFDFFVCVS